MSVCGVYARRLRYDTNETEVLYLKHLSSPLSNAAASDTSLHRDCVNIRSHVSIYSYQQSSHIQLEHTRFGSPKKSNRFSRARAREQRTKNNFRASWKKIVVDKQAPKHQHSFCIATYRRDHDRKKTLWTKNTDSHFMQDDSWKWTERQRQQEQRKKIINILRICNNNLLRHQAIRKHTHTLQGSGIQPRHRARECIHDTVTRHTVCCSLLTVAIAYECIPFQSLWCKI